MYNTYSVKKRKIRFLVRLFPNDHYAAKRFQTTDLRCIWRIIGHNQVRIDFEYTSYVEVFQGLISMCSRMMKPWSSEPNSSSSSSCCKAFHFCCALSADAPSCHCPPLHLTRACLYFSSAIISLLLFCVPQPQFATVNVQKHQDLWRLMDIYWPLCAHLGRDHRSGCPKSLLQR